MLEHVFVRRSKHLEHGVFVWECWVCLCRCECKCFMYTQRPRKKNEIFLCGEYGVGLHQRNERAVQNERRNIGKKNSDEHRQKAMEEDRWSCSCTMPDCFSCCEQKNRVANYICNVVWRWVVWFDRPYRLCTCTCPYRWCSMTIHSATKITTSICALNPPFSMSFSFSLQPFCCICSRFLVVGIRIFAVRVY